MNRSRAISGRKNKPTCTEPAENSHTMHAADDIYKSTRITPFSCELEYLMRHKREK